ncbi:MAG TPA: hypothetical protein VHU44_05145 [Acidobacteriaceae bacterium]|jgi:hypothetical protein|nr:hypothetical protein [Acidobacteriaceae bacterium]
MAGLQSSSSFEQAPVRGFSLLRPGADHGEDARSTLVLAVAGLLVASLAAGLLDLSPRWFANNMGSVLLQAARIVLMTAAIGGATVWALWYVVSDKASAGAWWVARNLCIGWVFLPCFELLNQAGSPWALAFAALVAVGSALSLRRLLPLEPEVVWVPNADSPLPSLDGLPPGDSPVVLATCVAVLLQAAVALALGATLMKAALPLGVAVFLLTWRWSAYETRAAEWWGGQYPPLRQFVAAVVVTAMTLVPYTIGEKSGWGIHPHMPVMKPIPSLKEAHASSGYFGIILYPPPKPKEVIVPRLQEETIAAGGLTKPLVIPFEGPYWYYKDAWIQPGPRSHVAHGQPTDEGINVRSTDLNPLMMQAHQKISRPINLDACGEIDVTVRNADTKPGEIDLALVLADSSAHARPRQVLAARPVLSSMVDPMPQDRKPVKEVLRFAVPAGAHLRRFDDLTVQFILAPRHARTGAKVSLESFELIPRR